MIGGICAFRHFAFCVYFTKTNKNDIIFTMDQVEEIALRYDKVLAEVRKIAPDATLVLASKTVSREVLEGLAARRPSVIYGENRVQELLSKYFVREGLTWQFIGRLQTNKVKYIVDKVSLIQSVDSLRLAEEIERRAAKIDKVMDVLVEVNVGEEESKGGVPKGELFPLLDEIVKMPHLRLKGLMSVLPATDDEALIPLYDELNDLFQEVKRKFGGEDFILSAGMSGDYALALRHGSTMVRIGSRVFGERHY